MKISEFSSPAKAFLCSVLLATVKTEAVSPLERTAPVRILVDPGSELSLATERIVHHLQLSRHPLVIPLAGIGGGASGCTRGASKITLRSLAFPRRSLSATVHLLPRLTTRLPSFTAKIQTWPHLRGLPLADPDFLTPGPIDIILGADTYGSFIEADVVKGAADAPIAQKTLFGWVVLGPVARTATISSGSVFHVSANDDLLRLLSKFWEQEEIQHQTIKTVARLNPTEQECEEHFVSTHSRDSSGRYTVRLPLLAPASQLGDSRATALRCFERLQRRLSSDENYSEQYSSFMREYEALDHMKQASEDNEQNSAVYYLPHHGVLREQSLTTKLRVVFNGSSLTTSGRSLNDILHTGAKSQIDITDVLLWTRRQRYLFATDIAKMFRQIRVHSADWDLQRIIWRDKNNRVSPYQLTTVTYGTRCAPFLAVRVLLQLVSDEGEKYPEAIAPMTKGRYVDDIYGGADTKEEAATVAKQLTDLCMAGGFQLQKWASHHLEVLSHLSADRVSSETSLAIEDNEVTVLGLCWNTSTDSFQYSARLLSVSKVTKRIILSETAQIFDPLGLISPVTIVAKILLQELWLERLGWDNTVPPRINQRWLQFRNHLADLSRLSIPRWLTTSSDSSVEIHGFSDASQLAMAATVYLRVGNAVPTSTVTLVCSKTKVAPLKRLTIPRLELSAAVLLSRLVSYVKQTLELNESPVFLWTDSAVTLTWIQSHPSRWKDFICNRVVQIQDALPMATWRFIPGKENPADCASRGLTPQQLADHHLWWNGPPWLARPPSQWPKTVPQPSPGIVLEERPGLTLNVTATRQPPIWGLVSRYSQLTRLLRITALCQIAVRHFLKQQQPAQTTLVSTEDLEAARLHWIRATQAAHFSAELKLLASGSTLPRTHVLTRLTAFIYQNGTLRVGGRLEHSLLESESKHPAILPRDSDLSRLIIEDAHRRTLHGGTRVTMAYVRRSYWIIGGRAPVRSLILRCVVCARQRGLRAHQLMGQLPATRVTPSRPFIVSGVDYAGPVTLKTWHGRAAKQLKGYLAIFVCFSTSAVHLEAVTDYSTAAFIAAYRRFYGRRGICRTLYSDCGTNFKGADKSLRNLFDSGSSEMGQLADILANDRTNWIFNPPAAPHFGGKWEAAVKSVKFHLKRTIGDTALTYEELTTLLTQIEAVLNSRPIGALSDDPDDLSVLTPGHFLVGEALTTVPEPSLTDQAYSWLSRWQLLQQKLQQFWKKWSAECLQRFQSISKWHHPSNELRVGTIVLLTDERFPPARWPLARVTELHPGSDGLTRVVTIKTSTSTYRRPISKLCILPISTTTSEDGTTFDDAVVEGGRNVG